MHILEDHVVPWLERWGIGAGLMGEQGAESLHAHLNTLEANFASYPDKVDRLRYIFEMYSLETTPTLNNLQPEKRRRKRKREEE